MYLFNEHVNWKWTFFSLEWYFFAQIFGQIVSMIRKRPRNTNVVQRNPALRTPALYGQFRLSRQKAHIFSLKLTRFIRTPVNTDNRHFSVSRVTNSHILSTLLYGHWLSAHCLFSLSQLCDNCRHCTLFK